MKTSGVERHISNRLMPITGATMSASDPILISVKTTAARTATSRF